MNEGAARTILAKLGCGRVTRSRDWLICSCPMAPYTHPKGSDEHPSFGVKISAAGISGYNCKTCHRQGRLSGLVRAMQWFSGEDFPGLALEADLADALSAPGDFEDNFVDEPSEPLSEGTYRDLFPRVTEHPEAIAYLAERRISADVADHLDLRYDQFEGRIIFPVRDPLKQLRGFTGRAINPATKPKVKDYYGLEKRFWLLGSDRVNPALPNLVVEGLIGWGRMFEIGADALVNPLALLGSELTVAKAEALIGWGRKTYLATDPDAAGETCLWGLPESDKPGAVDLLREHIPTFVPAWRDDLTDIDDATIDDIRDWLACTEYSPTRLDAELD